MNLPKIREFVLKNKITLGVGVALIILAFVLSSVFNKIALEKASDAVLPEVDLSFDAEGPYAQLFPRKDGNALVLNLQRTASYDSISYELAYTSTADESTMQGSKTLDTGDGESSPVGASIDRGVVGTIDTNSKKGQYEQEILFGTCSKNVCKYDKGVENGTLTLHIKKGKQLFRMITQWHLQKPDVSLGLLSSLDGHFNFKMDGDKQRLVLMGYAIVNDLTGLPKLPPGKSITGKVYALNVPITKEMGSGTVSVELADKPSLEAKIYRYEASLNSFRELDTKIDGSKLTAKSDGAGIFAVLTSTK